MRKKNEEAVVEETMAAEEKKAVKKTAKKAAKAAEAAAEAVTVPEEETSAPAEEPKAKKTVKRTAKKAAEVPVAVEIQYAGVSITYDELVKKTREAVGEKAEGVTLYVKPEERRAYFVVASGETGSFEI